MCVRETHRRPVQILAASSLYMSSVYLCGFFVFCYFGMFCCLAAPQGMQDLSSLTRDRTRTRCSGSPES